MKIVRGYPPNWPAIKAKLNPQFNTVFAWGNLIYLGALKLDSLPADLIHHEEVHSKQQGDNPAKWWDQYLADPVFRFHMELQAYQKQYEYFSQYNGRQRRRAFLRAIARDLAGANYGNVIGYVQAYELIKNPSLSTSTQT